MGPCPLGGHLGAQGASTALRSSGRKAKQSIAQNDGMRQLIAMLGAPIDMMIVLDAAYMWQSDSDYQALFAMSTLATAFLSSVRCRTGTVASEVPSMGGQQIKGMDQFVGQLAALGTRTATRRDCADVVACDLSGTAK